jgi:predicted RND superfamily exporter protein/CRP-like cAMP-binding protein
MAGWLARQVTRHARLVVAASLALALAAIVRIVDFGAIADQRWTEVSRLRIDPSMSSVLPDEDPARDFYEHVRDLFGNDETLLLAVRHPDGIFQPEMLASLKRTTAALERVSGVRAVMSLANTPNILSVEGDLVIEPLYDEPPRTSAEIERVRRELRANPILSKSLVSADGKTTSIVGYLLDMSEIELMASGVDDQFVETARREFGPDVDIWLSGGAHIKAQTQRMLLQDLATVFPIIGVVLMGIAFLSFRSLRGVAIPMLGLGLAIVWAIGLATFFLPDLNLVTTSAPAILLGVGFAYSIHVVSSYYEVIGEAGSPEGGAAGEALRRMALPTFLTCLTTGVGFLSLATSPIRAIQEFGLLCGVGVFCLLGSTLTFGPALLHLMTEKLPRSRAERSGEDWIDRTLTRLGKFDVEYRYWILAGGALLAVASVASIPMIEISTNVIENFPADSRIRQSIDAINAEMGAADRLYVVLEADETDAFKQPDNLRAIEALQQWLEEQPEVGGTSSITDHVKLLYRGFNDNDPDFFAVPDSKRLVSQLLLFGANDEIKRLVNSQYDIASIPVQVNIFNSSDIVGFSSRVDHRLEDLPTGTRGRVTGLSVLVARTNDDIALGQSLSLLTAFAVIYAILALLFLSFRVGLLALIPNALPVAIYFGVLGWTDITLNVVTGLVASLVLGIAVDDTIHFLARFNALARANADPKEGVRRALLEVGRPVTYTTAALCAGFLVITASSLQQQVEFGALSAFTLAVAWGVDVVFTPALAAGMRVVTLWDLLSLDLGKDPTHSIGLFRGLRIRQARVVALLGTLVDAPAGRALFHAGEPAEGLFVVIGGRVRTWVDSRDENLAVEVHDSGDTVGEVGLFHGQHVLNGRVEEPARLLRLTQGSLQLLTRRYPRIASVVLRNTNELLAERLAFHTQGQRLGEAFERLGGAVRDPLAPDAVVAEIGDAKLGSSLLALGIDHRTLRALGLIPMVQVAWADGELAERERLAILEAAQTLGIEAGSETHGLLANWLAAPPDPALFEAWHDYVAMLKEQLSVEGQLRLREQMLGRVRVVAEAHGGVAGLRTVSRREEQVILSIEQRFEAEQE